MIEVGQVYYYVKDDVYVLRVVSVDDVFVNFTYLRPGIMSDKEIHQWGISDFERDHKPVTKLHKLLKGIE
jgi:hypothetical protein